MRRFEEARAFVRKLKLKDQKEWISYCKSGKKPSNIPENPYETYKDKDWISWFDWLGKKEIVLGVVVPIEIAEKVRSIAEKDRRSVSQTILIWIENELNRRENKPQKETA